jgi:nuclear receptor subfamily 2 group E protein 1
MNRDAVQHERGPRNSTLRRQMSLYFKDQHSPPPISPPTVSALPHITPFTPFTCSSMPFISLPPPHYTTPLSRPSPPFSMPAPPLSAAPPFLTDSFSKSFQQLQMSLLSRGHHAAAAAPNGLLMPTPKYPHEVRPTPTPTPPISENISEMAARLLFMNVRWAQHVPAFTSLPYRDQMTLLEESWRELFVLSSAQFALPVELAAPSVVEEASLLELKNLQESIQKFQAMNVDPTEFACLRAIILLKTHIEQKELRDQTSINSLQDQAQLTLSKYISNAYPNQPSRFGKLLLLLPSLKAINGKAIEELFFKKTIGAIPIERIICDMYKAGSV